MEDQPTRAPNTVPDVISPLNNNAKPVKVRDRFCFVATGFLVAHDVYDIHAISFKRIPLH